MKPTVEGNQDIKYLQQNIGIQLSAIAQNS